MHIIVCFKNTLKKLSKTLLFIYTLFLIYILFLYPDRSNTYNNYNLSPFSTIKKYIKYYDHFDSLNWFLNIFGNIIIFIPIGILLPIIFKRINTFTRITLISIFLSLSVESIQYYSKVGEFDIDDIILNTLGAIIGYIFIYIINRIINRK